jgi:hypothetical protein
VNLNKFPVRVDPSDRIAQSEGSTRLDASLPEHRNGGGFQNGVLFQKS